ncbi:MAG: hypothetical protein COA74_07375 [Gammaproteobacteria bacterium]|nr:MAG: hypothetical protein COA74_07375 [Gammaproteobacteria bacterium]
MKLNLKLLTSSIAILTSSMAIQAQDISITIDNLTQGIIFTPFLVAAHGESDHLFEVGTTASSELQMMAEGGDISGLVTNMEAINATLISNPAEGLLMAGASTTGAMDTGSNGYLSLVSMLLPTNDGFVGLDGWEIPTEAGTYVVTLNAYDAGTEANDEIINGGGAPGTPGIPAAPAGNAGANATGVTTTESNNMIHIHRGNVGDDDLTAGISDVDNRIHRWLNPVVRLTIVVN